ncbi:TPA_asm: hypothetical protein [ssRNA phage Gephyllon.4_4]|uniref:Uncharacterized protein n=2 Tax=unclassified Fiersviridae TaxID=2852980 RepID=A0A8S5KYN3_9VIRU|nr:hypothetical protein QIK85_gp1 [ssRNA phage Gephyllon.4_4]QDH87346.1 MAG: hypothetical protein H4BulkLitter22333_000001 [Leviviridae sp.]DAD50149.1 TPA_asm: hypothetical protein [ssRNA phage Gephyllon.4_4]
MARKSLKESELSKSGGISIVFVPGKVGDFIDHLFVGVNDEFFFPIREFLLNLGLLDPEVMASCHLLMGPLRVVAMRAGARESSLYPTAGGVH